MGRNRKARQEWDKAMQESGQPMMAPTQKPVRKRTSGIFLISCFNRPYQEFK